MEGFCPPLLECPENGLLWSDPSLVVSPALTRDLDAGGGGQLIKFADTEASEGLGLPGWREPAPGNTGSEFQVTGVRNRPPRAIPAQKDMPHLHRWQGNEVIQDSTLDLNPGLGFMLLFFAFPIAWL